MSHRVLDNRSIVTVHCVHERFTDAATSGGPVTADADRHRRQRSPTTPAAAARPAAPGASPRVIGRMITAGELPVGTRLPTVRELSTRLGVSPTTVSEAWHCLAASAPSRPAAATARTSARRPGPAGRAATGASPRGPGHFELDLSTGTPDPALLPDLGPVVSRVGKQSLTSSYLDHPVLPALEDELRGDVAVRARGDDRRRRGDGRPRPRRPGRAAPRRPRRRRAPRLPADARPARPARLRRRRRRRRRRRARRSPACAPRSPTATCAPCSCSRGRRTRPASRLTRAAGQGARRRARRAATRSSSRTTTPTTSRPPALVSLGTWLPGAHRAHPQLLQVPRPRPAPRRRRRRRRRRHGRRQPPAARARAGRAGSCRRCCSSCCRTRRRPR